MLHNIKQWLSDEANFASFKLATQISCGALAVAITATIAVLCL